MSLLTQLGQNALSAGLVVLSGVNNAIPTPTPMMEYLKQGTTQIVAEDIVDYATGQGSLILNLDYKNFIDRVLFASGFVYVLNRTGVTGKAVQLVDQVSPLPEMVNDALINGGLIMANRTTATLMDASSTINQTPLVYLNHFSNLFSSM